MKRFILISSAILGGSSIALGAFGAHALKKILSQEKLLTFEVGVRLSDLPCALFDDLRPLFWLSLFP